MSPTPPDRVDKRKIGQVEIAAAVFIDDDDDDDEDNDVEENFSICLSLSSLAVLPSIRANSIPRTDSMLSSRFSSEVICENIIICRRNSMINNEIVN